ncbi:MAG: hypothetical protein IPM82_08750 [Saprospiraceae bacterium]|nr:hypothetical protein [Saprospiraceae bacterium]
MFAYADSIQDTELLDTTNVTVDSLLPGKERPPGSHLPGHLDEATGSKVRHYGPHLAHARRRHRPHTTMAHQSTQHPASNGRHQKQQ